MFQATQISCENLSIDGSANLIELNITEKMKIKGKVLMNKGQVEELELIRSSEMILIDMVVNNINIIDDLKVLKTQILTLKGKTIIEGNIKFKSGKGAIIKDKEVIIKNPLKTGIIVKNAS